MTEREQSMARHPAGRARRSLVAKVVLADGTEVEPTAEGVGAIERLVREGWTLAAATIHITGGPRIVRQP